MNESRPPTAASPAAPNCGQGHLRLWITVFVLAAVLRTAICLYVSDPFGKRIDAPQYERMGCNLWQHGVLSKDTAPPFRPSAYREPVYPVFLAGCCGLFGPSPVAAAVAQSVLGAVGVVLACVVVTQLAGTMRLALVVLTGCAYLALEAVTTPWWVLMREDLLTALTLLLILLGSRWLARPSLRLSVLIGVLVGLGVLAKATMIAVLPALWLTTWRYRSVRDMVRMALPTLAITLVLVAPALVRNHRLFGVWTLTTSSGLMLYLHSGDPNVTDGVEPEARDLAHRLAQQYPDVGELSPPPGATLDTLAGWMHFCNAVFPTRLAQAQGLTEEQADHVLLRIATEDIRRAPARYVRITAQHIVRFITGGVVFPHVIPHEVIAARSTIKQFYRVVVEPTWKIGIVVLGLIGLYIARRNAMSLTIILIAVFHILQHSICSAGELRYRMGAEVMLLMLALVTFAHVVWRTAPQSTEVRSQRVAGS